MRILYRFMAAGLALILLTSMAAAWVMPRVKRETNEKRVPVSAGQSILSAPVLGGEYDSSKKPAFPKYSEGI